MADEHTKQENDRGEQQCHMPESDPKVFEFLRLPAEIRNKIYWNVLVKRHMVYHFRQPALTLVNKQIRAESLPVLHGNGLFFFNMRGYGDIFRPQKLWPGPPATSNLIHITKLDILFTFDLRKGGLELLVCMRDNKWECGHLLNKEPVGKPGVQWKNQVWVQAAYRRLSKHFLQAGGPALEIYRDSGALRKKRDVVVKSLLYFSEMCPAAAEWVWMALRRRRSIGWSGSSSMADWTAFLHHT